MIQFYSIGIIALLSAMSPGPDFIIITRLALNDSRKSAIFCALGIAAGILIHASYCVMGLAIVLAKSIVTFNIIKYLGANYLIYLGIKSLLDNSKLNMGYQKSSQPIQQTPTAAFRQGFLVNLLNPKCSLFMLSVFTLMIEPGSSKWIQFSYGIEIATIALVWFCVLALSVSSPIIKNKFSQFQTLISKITGAVLLVLASKIILD